MLVGTTGSTVQLPYVVHGNVLLALMAYLLNLIATLLGLVLHNRSLDFRSLEELNGQAIGTLVELVDCLDVVPSVIRHSTVRSGQGRTSDSDRYGLSLRAGAGTAANGYDHRVHANLVCRSRHRESSCITRPCACFCLIRVGTCCCVGKTAGTILGITFSNTCQLYLGDVADGRSDGKCCTFVATILVL